MEQGFGLGFARRRTLGQWQYMRQLSVWRHVVLPTREFHFPSRNRVRFHREEFLREMHCPLVIAAVTYPFFSRRRSNLTITKLKHMKKFIPWQKKIHENWIYMKYGYIWKLNIYTWNHWMNMKNRYTWKMNIHENWIYMKIEWTWKIDIHERWIYMKIEYTWKLCIHEK